MALNVPLFNALAPEFESYDATARDLVAAEAERMVNPTIWGLKKDMGVVYMTAHMLKMASEAGGNTAGPVTMEKVGDLQRSYGSSSDGGNGELGKTRYGLEFIRVRRSLQISPFVVT